MSTIIARVFFSCIRRFSRPTGVFYHTFGFDHWLHISLKQFNILYQGPKICNSLPASITWSSSLPSLPGHLALLLLFLTSFSCLFLFVKNVPPETLGDLALSITSSPSKNYFFIIFATCLALIFVGGLVFGRLSKRIKREVKDR